MAQKSQKQLALKMVQACRLIESSEELPALTRVARHVSLSPAYFQKVFSKALGISPRHYADALRFDRLRRKLQTGSAVSRALYDAGFGASSRLYEFTGRYLGMTPGAYQKKGEGVRIVYSLTDSPLGVLLLAATGKGLCTVRLGKSRKLLERELKKEFAAAELRPLDKKLRVWTQALIDYLSGTRSWPLLPYDIRATAFQRRVWEWLRTIPAGTTYSYSEAARAIGKPSAARAVARACASNPAALVIPCHRIIPKTGGIGGYRWHPSRKEKLLKLEETLRGK